MSGARQLPHQWLFTRLWRRPWFRRQFYNALGYAFRRKQSWRMMNCGLARTAALPDLPDEWRDEGSGYQLYAALVDGTALAGRDVLELGAGRGGGSRFLHRCYAPRRVVALDYAAATTRWCRRRFAAPGLEFVSGDASAPPFPAASFDVIAGVEVTHCLPDKARFLASAARILRPGGRLLIADFFYRRPDAMHALGKFQAALAASPFTVVAEEDWTPEVIAAIEQDSDRRAAEIAGSVPSFLRSIASGFTSTTASSTYTGLRAGRTVYLRYVLALPGPSA